MALIVYRRQNRVRFSWHAMVHKNLKSAALNFITPIHAILSFKLRQNLTPTSLWFRKTRRSVFTVLYVLNYAISRKFVTNFIITFH